MYIYIFITSLYILVLGISHFYAIFIPGRPDCGIPRPRLSVRRRARRGSAATSRQRRPAIGNNLIFLQLSSSFNRGSPHLAGWVRKRKIPAINGWELGVPPILGNLHLISNGFPMDFRWCFFVWCSCCWVSTGLLFKDANISKSTSRTVILGNTLKQPVHPPKKDGWNLFLCSFWRSRLGTWRALHLYLQRVKLMAENCFRISSSGTAGTAGTAG